MKNVARVFNASIELVFVEKTGSDITAFENEKLQLLNRLREFEPVFRFIKNESIEAGIEMFAKDYNIDLVLVVPRKHGIFHKSQSEQVIFHLPVPAMTMHED